MNLIETSHTDFIKKKEDTFFFVTLFLGVFCYGFYQIVNLYELDFYQQINIAFDFDQAWFIDIVSRSSDSWLYKNSVEQTPLLIKHPLIYLFRFPAELLQFIGISEAFSVIYVSLFFISLTPALFYACLRYCQFTQLNSAILTCCFVFTATFQTNMVVLDSYSIAQFWILAGLLLFITSIKQQNINNTGLKAVVYVVLAGTTSYLVLFAALCELVFVFYMAKKIKMALLIRYLLNLMVKFSLLFTVLFVIIYSDSLIALLTDPVAVLKKTLWAVARPGDKEGLWKLIETFLIYSIFSPTVSAVTIEQGITMLDYRVFDFSLVGYFALLLLAVLYLSMFTKITSPVVLLSVVWLVVNLLFHLVYQDRGSLFLYTGHILPVMFFALCFGMAKFKNYMPVVGLCLLSLLVYENVNTDIEQSIRSNAITIEQEGHN